MGSGKTTVGKTLARKLDMEFVDTDTIIEDLFKAPVNDYFRFLGEAKFRETERKVLEEVIKHDDIVVSTGGGLPCYNDNVDLMNKTGLTVYLKLSPSAIHFRLLHSKKKRPLIENLNYNELKDFIDAKLSEREIYYNKACLIYPGESLDFNSFINEIRNHIK